MIIKTTDLWFDYDNKNILKGINLELYKGDTLAVVGESGAGKTTLGLALSGLTGQLSGVLRGSKTNGRVTKGKILYKGQDLLQLKPEELWNIRWSKIAYVFQNVVNAFNPVLPILDQVAEPVIEHGLGNRSEAMQRAREKLALVGFPSGHEQKYPHQLSGGEIQRALIAMALINDPEVLILDEPTASLDPVTRKDMLALLKKAAANCAVLLITHDLSAARALSQRTAVLYKGRIVEEGPTTKVIDTPHHPYMRALLRSYPNMTTTKDIQSIKYSEEDYAAGCPFALRCTQAIPVCHHQVPDLKEFNISEQLADKSSVQAAVAKTRVACHRGGIVPYLVVHNLKKKYESFALTHVNFIVFEGETVALVGQSGSGKSTIARMIMGLQESDQGTILLEEQKIPPKRDKTFYRKVQMIFQNPYDAVSRRMTVRDALKEPLMIQNISNVNTDDKIKNVLEEVGLPAKEGFLNSYPDFLSGGEIQRLAIARSLMLDPKLLIADEPTSALDALVQARVLKLLMNLQEQRGLGMLFITHDIALARKIADRIIVIKDGAIIEQGQSRMIVYSAKHPYTQELIQAAAEL